MASQQHHLARIGAAIACAAGLAHGVSLAQSPPAPAGESRSNQLNIQRVVFGAFPEADAYRGIKRPVSQPHRRQIEKKLPFKVHFNELGEHELLVAFRGRRPVGVVYCRTEEADWGLAVIAWHISLDQRIVGFQFLRGRNRNIQDLEQSQIATDLRGSSFAQVAQLTTAHDKQNHRERDPSLVSIERTTLRSAAKVLAVVSIVWQDQIESLSDQAHGFDLFPTATRFTRRTTTFPLQRAESQQQISSKVLYAYDGDNMFLGCMAWTRGQEGMAEHALRWAIDRNMRVLTVQAPDSPRDTPLRKACTQLKGKSLVAEPAQGLALSPLGKALGTAITELAQGRIR